METERKKEVIKATILVAVIAILSAIVGSSFAENSWTRNSASVSSIATTTINSNITNKVNSTSPVLNYTFNGPDVFYSAGAISSITDKSGNNNTGTANNLKTYIGRVGQGLKFNGTNSYIEPTTSINPIQSISFWIKSDSTTQSIMQLNATQNISIVSGTITTTGFSSTVFVDGVNTTIYPNDNDWHNITITTGTGINANDIDIGRIDTTYYSGLLDEVIAYDRELSSTEVGNIAGFGRRRVVVKAKPLPLPVYSSCKNILDTGGSIGDGIYSIDPDGNDGNAAFQVYCDMTTDGGGWTMIANSIQGGYIMVDGLLSANNALNFKNIGGDQHRFVHSTGNKWILTYSTQHIWTIDELVTISSCTPFNGGECYGASTQQINYLRPHWTANASLMRYDANAGSQRWVYQPFNWRAYPGLSSPYGTMNIYIK